MAHTKRVVYQESTYDLTYELKKCKECSCSRCSLNGTPGCYIEIAIKEINRYEQAMDSIGNPNIYENGLIDREGKILLTND